MDSLGYAAMPRSLGAVLEELYLLKAAKPDLKKELDASIKQSDKDLVFSSALKIHEYHEKKTLLKQEIETIQSAKKFAAHVPETTIDLSRFFQPKEINPFEIPQAYSTYSATSTNCEFIGFDYDCALENILIQSFHEAAEEQETPTAESAHQDILHAIKMIADGKMARSPKEVQLKQEEEEYLARLNKKKKYIDSKTDIELKRWCKKLKEIYSALIDVKDDDVDVIDLGNGLEQSVVDLGQSTIQKVKDDPGKLLKEIELFEQLLEYVKPRLEKLIKNERDSYEVNTKWDAEKANLEKQKVDAEKAEKKRELIDAIKFKKVAPYPGMDEVDVLADIQNGINLQRAQIIIIHLSNSKWKTITEFQDASLRLVDELNQIEDTSTYVKTVEYELIKTIMKDFDLLKHRPLKTQ